MRIVAERSQRPRRPSWTFRIATGADIMHFLNGRPSRPRLPERGRASHLRVYNASGGLGRRAGKTAKQRSHFILPRRHMRLVGQSGPAAPQKRPGSERTGPCTLWRRGRDSNSRTPERVNGFRDRRIQPLCHLSREWKRRPLGTPRKALAESQGFEPWRRFRRLHDFQSCSFDHSDNSP